MKTKTLSGKSTPLWTKFTAMDGGKCGKDRRWVRAGEKTMGIVQKTVSLFQRWMTSVTYLKNLLKPNLT